MLGHGGVTGGLFRVGAKKKVLPSGLRRCKPKTPKSSTREKVLFLKFFKRFFFKSELSLKVVYRKKEFFIEVLFKGFYTLVKSINN